MLYFPVRGANVVVWGHVKALLKFQHSAGQSSEELYARGAMAESACNGAEANSELHARESTLTRSDSQYSNYFFLHFQTHSHTHSH